MTVVAYLGKPTSGRFVYKTRETKQWVWQCDLHPCPEDEGDCFGHPGEWGEGFATMQDALTGALAHASTCPYSNNEKGNE